MIFKTTSINEVIGRVIRNTRLQDSSYIQDMFEWIPEAMGQLKTNMTLSRQFEDVEISFHKGKLPCGLYHLDAVEYKGRRLPYSSTRKNYLTGQYINDKNGSTQASTVDTFTSTIQGNPNPVTNENTMWNPLFVQDNPPVITDQEDTHNTDWYQTEMDWITTSFPDGMVRIHFLQQPMDSTGMPLIPDNENYKEALYCYVRAKMIGAGFQDPVYKEEQLMQRFETYGRRAINQITYPSPEQKEQQLKTMLRFIPPANYYENFFRVDKHENPY